jgi:hypothetical protein
MKKLRLLPLIALCISIYALIYVSIDRSDRYESDYVSQVIFDGEGFYETIVHIDSIPDKVPTLSIGNGKTGKYIEDTIINAPTFVPNREYDYSRPCATEDQLSIIAGGMSIEVFNPGDTVILHPVIHPMPDINTGIGWLGGSEDTASVIIGGTEIFRIIGDSILILETGWYEFKFKVIAND